MNTAGVKKTVQDLMPGRSGQILRLSASGALKQRLLDMGLLPNTVVTVQRRAPAGGPVWLLVDSCQLSLRSHEAAAVAIVPVSA